MGRLLVRRPILFGDVTDVENARDEACEKKTTAMRL